MSEFIVFAHCEKDTSPLQIEIIDVKAIGDISYRFIFIDLRLSENVIFRESLINLSSNIE